MIGNIGSYTTATNTGSTASAASNTVPVNNAPVTQDIKSAPVGTSGTVTISILASQLADSAARAQVRDSTLNHAQLADKAKVFTNELLAESNPAVQAKHDSEVPQKNAPELLARAKQATAFLVSRRHGGSGEQNPFAGLSRDQLANITYDDSGTYTFNERAAAFAESERQEYEWGVKVTTQAMNEYNNSGKLTHFFQSILDHFKGLPAIEQAQYPKEYASDLEAKIKLDFNYRTHTAGGNHKTLIESLLNPDLFLTDNKTVIG